MSDLKCIVFDMDGTLTQTNQLIFDSFNHIAKKYQGKIYSEPEITAMFGPPEEGALLAIVGENQINEAMQDYLSFYRDNHNRLAQLYPGIIEVLDFILKQGCHLALFTGKGIHTTTITLEQFHLTEYFNFIVTGSDVVQHKPSAEGIRKILSHFSLKPNNVLMVGDSVGDVKAAHEAGVKIASVLWDSYAKEKVLQMKSDYVFHNVQELYTWLRQHFD
ncbi:MAG: HAD-IA family hydrolase [Ignavibacteriales bacterium]|nr:HAD-IA family hydrolase [Ignavibacteriales bacterium]